MNKLQSQYHLPFADVAEISLMHDALTYYRKQHEGNIEQIMKKVGLLFDIATTEEKLSKLNQEFFDLTGHEPDLL